MKKDTTHICLATCHYEHDPSTWWRQTPKNDGAWKNTQFHLNDESQCSWLCVFDGPPYEWKTHIPKERRMLVIAEPKDVKTYLTTYLNQFHHVISPYKKPLSYQGQWYRSPPLYMWYYGAPFAPSIKETKSKTFSRAAATSWQAIARPKKKTKTLSAVSSLQYGTSLHFQRYHFIPVLQQELGDAFDMFGRGYRFISDKADALDAYRYHLVLENNQDDHFWTEKLSDAYLAECYPIYVGCSNLHDYFPKQAYSRIDIDNIPQAVSMVKDIIASNLWQKNHKHILTAKRLVMERYNLLPFIANITNDNNHLQEKPTLEKKETIHDSNMWHKNLWSNKIRRYTNSAYWVIRKRRLQWSIERRYRKISHFFKT